MDGPFMSCQIWFKTKIYLNIYIYILYAKTRATLAAQFWIQKNWMKISLSMWPQSDYWLNRFATHENEKRWLQNVHWHML